MVPDDCNVSYNERTMSMFSYPVSTIGRSSFTAARIWSNGEPFSDNNGAYELVLSIRSGLIISPQAAGQKRCAATMDEKLLSLELAHTTPSKSKAKILLADILMDDDVVIPRIVDLKQRITAKFWIRQ